MSESITFLGAWCLRYSRREIWSSLEYRVADYHWSDRLRIAADLEYITLVYENLLRSLADQLNQIHGVNYSVRYWRIVIGWWLYYFAQVFFDRWQVLRVAEQSFPNSVLYRLPPTPHVPAANDTREFLQVATTDGWNERLFADIAERWTNIRVDAAPKAFDMKAAALDEDVTADNPSRPSTSLMRSLAGIAPWFSQRRLFAWKVAMHRELLPRWKKMQLQLLMGQMPIPTPSLTPRHFEPDLERRQWKLNTYNNDPFEVALAQAIPWHLPSIFLEGYPSSSRLATSSGSNRDPLVVFTAHAFADDDLWKLQTAAQVERGSRLVVTQHGGHYGIGRWSSLQRYEVSICDRYLSWGWRDPAEPKVFPSSSTRLFPLKKLPPSQKGKCLLVSTSFPRQSYRLFSAPTGPDAERYFEDQLRFAQELSPEVRNDFVVRLNAQDFGWDVAQRWTTFDGSVKLDSGQSPIKELLINTRLLVATANGTTFLESFVQDIPTVIFWDERLWETCADAGPYLDALRSTSVLFADPESCAHHINGIWGDVRSWWSSSDVQDAVEIFSSQFAGTGKHPLLRLRRSLSRW